VVSIAELQQIQALTELLGAPEILKEKCV